MRSLTATGTEADATPFGSGGDRPYELALRRGRGRLVLHGSPAGRRSVDVARFARPADDVDRRLVDRLRGPLLDVGCGPGRMVAAARERGLPVLGIDVSRIAVELARRSALPVLRRSVFQPLPAERNWASVLLLDGNIGIGGDPGALLERCARLARPDGRVIVEVDSDPEADTAFTGVLSGEAGETSEPFAWAEVGADALTVMAVQVGLRRVASWTDSGRAFVGLQAGR